MLGVVRIYSRKAQYLFDDAKDVRDKIAVAFRPGDVSLPAEHLQASRNAITIEDGGDMVMNTFNTAMDWEDIAKNFTPLGLHVANQADITLPRAHYASSIRSASVARESESGLDSQSYGQQGGIDLGLDLGDDTMSVEMGRDARSERASSILSHRRDRSMSLLSGKPSARGQGDDVLRLGSDAGGDLAGRPGGAGGPMDIDLGGEQLDLGLDLDFGDGFGEVGYDDDYPVLEAPHPDDRDYEIPAGEATEVAPPPPPAAEPSESQGPSSIARDMSPGTANRIAELNAAHERRVAAAAAARESRPKKRVRIADAVDEDIELEQGVGRRNVDAILGEANYLPSNKGLMAFLQIRQDPAAYYSPTVTRDEKDYYLAAPLNTMADELADLFMVPVQPGDRRGPVDEDDDVEEARRQQGRHSERFNPDAAGAGPVLDDDGWGDVVWGGDDFGDGFGEVGYQDDGPMIRDDDQGAELARKRTGSLAPSLIGGDQHPSRAGSVARDILDARAQASGLSADCPVAFFDTRLRSEGGAPQTQGQSQFSSALEEKSQGGSGQGWSRNTVMAVEYLRTELEGADAALSFKKATTQVSLCFLRPVVPTTHFYSLSLNIGIQTGSFNHVFRNAESRDKGHDPTRSSPSVWGYPDFRQTEIIRRGFYPCGGGGFGGPCQ